MTKSLDLYPTRLPEHHAPVRRRDPVVHSRNQHRWNGPLDEVALSHYERDGFLWFEGFFSQESMQPFFEELKEMAQDPEMLKSEQVISDPASGAIRSVFGMHELSERFSKLTRDPRILGMVRQLLGSEVYIHQSRINDKYGFQGSGFDWHSDFETWHAEDGMPRMRAVSASLMLTDNNEFNGPLMLIPGSHHQFVPCVGETPEANWESSLKAQKVGVPDETVLADLGKRGGIQSPKGPAGSLLLFECNVLHASNGNMSPWPRSNLFFVYNSVDNPLGVPYAAKSERPEYLGARRNVKPLEIHDDFPELAGQGVEPLQGHG
ncbi:ectoine hydroxylase [Halopseudomonas laoshanensis]|uniref:Ectoine hydroxylase n=1 Tax=Halopseudomonas laoshanensis TaxID=2268758 RepID=A0A7V7GW87_9GAMM|nr:ectoine hydroxylase [Halopseudomonas laoshanensis]KAA0696527.1 ectoine hydroxylase [Halopseudomonas laoshanensis]MBQ0742091.1 ectoine hydroxylase [Pseudomonas sp.]WOD09659.1 ectoine hydroxylase [Pseudomonas sp. NyZ704]